MRLLTGTRVRDKSAARGHGALCANEKTAQRLMQIYVAMTRPTHLLCLALRNGSLGVGSAYASNQQKLIARGWSIQHLSASTVAAGG